MHERELERKHHADQDLDRDAPTPGRANASAVLQRRAEPMASGILMRKARDANGVANDAESAVAAASGSGGASLPATLQRKFEASLGTDLSSVRVHTGGSSETAATSVGAKAYTMGQDIHFGAGQFDPGSRAGEHLIAHEVAHTVQQRGGSATRQHKLEVSGPQDAAEHEADRAADAMTSGKRFSVGGAATAIARKDDEIVMEEDYASPSSQMRDDGEKAVKKQREAEKVTGPSRSELGTTNADTHHAASMITKIEEARGTLGMMKGKEDAANKEGQDGMLPGKTFVAYNEAANAISHNTAMHGKLSAFENSANRQGFQHTFFAQSFKQLSEDFLQLKATVDVIKAQNLQVTGDQAKSDIEKAKKENPQLGVAIGALQAAATDLDTMATHATSGVGAIASTAGGTFDALGTATDKMKLPAPKLEDSAEQAKASAEVNKINADLAAAKASIATIKSVASISFSLATGGASGVGMKIAESALSGLGKRAEDIAEKHIDPHTDKLRHTKGAKDGAGKAQAAAADALEDKLADWMTGYSGKIAAANGKLSSLNDQVKEKYAMIATEEVTNLQRQLADQVGKFSKLLLDIEKKKAAVTEAARKVQDEAGKLKSKSGTNIGAAAQAMGSVSTFLTQCDVTENLGRQEQVQGDDAQAKLQDAAGDYHEQPRDAAFPGGPKGLAETASNGENGQGKYFLCKRSADADQRGTFDFSGYEVQEGRIMFVVNEDDVDERSVVMKDRTDEQMKRVMTWKGEATGFKAAVQDALGLGPSQIK